MNKLGTLLKEHNDLTNKIWLELEQSLINRYGKVFISQRNNFIIVKGVRFIIQIDSGYLDINFLDNSNAYMLNSIEALYSFIDDIFKEDNNG